MLKLEKMELVGFKSFQGKTHVLFPEGITAVVGPNGCGKSNIGDAISWVLGEQSVKSLRGEKMEDVIFNGSERKKPLGMAEVSLKLIPGNGSTPHNGSEEIILTRRLFRSGESEYLLNGERCRLKDIRNLLFQVHIGARTCAVIEQGRVEEIMNARPVERRLLIEEAAGILGYKGKRKLAEMKLEATKVNLLRVQDILTEVEKQMNSLRRQASRARRFTRLNEAKRQKQALLFVLRYTSLDAELSQIDSVLGELKAKEAEGLAQIGTLEAALEKGKQELLEQEENLSMQVEEEHLLDKEMVALETSVRSSGEKAAELEAAILKLVQERDTFCQEIAETENSILGKEKEKSALESRRDLTGEKLREQENGLRQQREQEDRIDRVLEEKRETLIRLAQSVAGHRNDLKAFEAEMGKITSSLEKKKSEENDEANRMRTWKEDLSAIDGQRGEKEKELSTLQSSLGVVTSKVEFLRRELVEREKRLSEKSGLLRSLLEEERIYQSPEVLLGGIDAGTQAILKGDERVRIKNSGVVADWVKAGSACEKATEGYMSELLPALVVGQVEDAVEGIRLVRSSNAGSARFLFRLHQARGPEEVEIPEGISRNPGFIGRLSEKIEYTDGVREILEPLLRKCLVVRDIDTAREFCRSHPALDYVTLEGEVIRSGCLAIMNNSAAEGDGILARKRKLQSIREEIERVRKEREENGKELENIKVVLNMTLDEEKSVWETIKTLEDERLALKHKALHLSELLAQAEKKCQVLHEEISLDEEELREAGIGLDKSRGELAAGERELEERENEVRLLKTQSEEARKGLSEKGEELSLLYSEFAEKNKEVAVLETGLDHLRKSRDDAFRRIAESHRSESEWKQTLSGLQEDMVRSRAIIAEVVLKQKDLSDRIESLRNEISGRKESLQLMESEVKEQRVKLDGLRESLKEKEIARGSIHSDRKHIAEKGHEELGKTMEELLSTVALPPEASKELLAREVSELQEIITRIGPINMMAMEEYDKLEERFRFLSAQRKDLTDSMESLQETIRKINRTSRERFLKAFETIRENFNETFQILFRGGKADLRLEEEQDVLESGLEIIAQPPGKRLQNINLMSGGEKALTAIALLFAVFRYQPSPFCLLDEADAALDDLNVNRFLNLLKEFSDRTQFILITHNKKTMEVANILYGVTMEEPGISKIVSLRLH